MKRNRHCLVAVRRDNLDGQAARRTAAYRSPYDMPRGTRPSRRAASGEPMPRPYSSRVTGTSVPPSGEPL